MTRWIVWTITVLLSASYVFAWRMGVIDFLLTVDKTYITLIIAALLLAAALVSSWMTLTYKYPRYMIEQLHYVVDHLTALGMLGTTVALFMAVFKGIPTPEVMLTTMSLALTTTIAGLIGNIIGNQLIIQVERGKHGYQTKE